MRIYITQKIAAQLITRKGPGSPWGLVPHANLLAQQSPEWSAIVQGLRERIFDTFPDDNKRETVKRLSGYYEA